MTTRSRFINRVIIMMILTSLALVLAAQSPAKAISRGYDTLKLGMAYQAVYDALVSNTSLDYRGTPDVSLSPGKDEKIIEARGGRYIKRGIFQFKNEKLFTIILEFNPEQIDYYGLYTLFVQRYNEAAELSPQECAWQDAATRLVLEKPLTLKYIDLSVFLALQKEAGIESSTQEQSRASFLDRL